MSCRLVWEPEGVLAIYEGGLPSAGLLDVVRRIQSDPRFDDARYVIHDFSAVSRHDIGQSALTDLAALHYGAKLSSPNCRIVFVTTDSRLTEEIRKILGGDLKSYQCEVRPTLVDARDWLDAQPQLMLLSDVMGFIGR